MPFDLLHFGSGVQAIHYWILCLTSILGTIQCAAVRYHRNDLVWINGRGGYVFGLASILAGFAWFFLVDEEAFVPGLAGAELFTVFAAAFVIAVPVTRLFSFGLSRIAIFFPAPPRAPLPEPISEDEPLL